MIHASAPLRSRRRIVRIAAMTIAAASFAAAWSWPARPAFATASATPSVGAETPETLTPDSPAKPASPASCEPGDKATAELRGTGDLALIIERAAGAVTIAETTTRRVLGRVEGLGDLSHASAVYGPAARFAYVFGRDGGVTKIDMLRMEMAARVVQAGNSIGGAISADGRVVAVSNYEPGGVRLLAASDLSILAEIPADDGNGARSKVVGLVDAPGNRFVFSLFDADQIWVADVADPKNPKVTRYTGIGSKPYDALVTPDGRHYVAGLFGEDGLALLDLWAPADGVRKILAGYGRGEEPLPVYKMPHLEGWAAAGDRLFFPAVGRHEVLIADRSSWKESGRISVHGQPVFAIARPGGRHVWVNFAFPDNDTLQVIDTLESAIIRTIKPGKGALHMEFTPRGDQVWVSVRDEDLVRVYDCETFEELTSFSVDKPSGIFFASRAGRIGL